MVRKILKWGGIVLGAVVGIVLVGVVVLYLIGGSKVNRSYDIQPEPVAIPTDAAAIARGRHLAEAVTGCVGCHGEGLSGDILFDEPPLATIYAPNLTSGQGGRGSYYTDADWVRSIRHGVKPDGKGLLIMPAEVFQNLGEEDLGAIIAYVKSLPPVDNETPAPVTNRPMGRLLMAIGAFGELVPAQLVDHDAPFPDVPTVDESADYGEYLVSIAGCTVCHGENLSGGQPGDPASPPAPNLTPGGALGNWSQAQFFETIRTGVTPAGRELDDVFMPWEEFAVMTDQELGAVWLHLQSLTAHEFEE